MDGFCGSLLFLTLVILGILAFRAFFLAVTPPDPLIGRVTRTPVQRGVFSRRLITIWRLLYETRWLAGSVLTIPGVFCFIRLHDVSPVAALEISGLTLQIFGLLLVFYQLVKLREKFNKQSYSNIVLDWFQRLGRALYLGKPRHYNISAADGISMSVSFTGGELKSVLKLNETLSLQDQVKYLAKVIENYDNLYEGRFKNIRKDLDAMKANINQLTDSERKSREALAKVVESVSVADHALELLGVFWLTAGVLLSTIPESIYNLFIV